MRTPSSRTLALESPTRSPRPAPRDSLPARLGVEVTPGWSPPGRSPFSGCPHQPHLFLRLGLGPARASGRPSSLSLSPTGLCPGLARSPGLPRSPARSPPVCGGGGGGAQLGGRGRAGRGAARRACCAAGWTLGGGGGPDRRGGAGARAEQRPQRGTAGAGRAGLHGASDVFLSGAGSDGRRADRAAALPRHGGRAVHAPGRRPAPAHRR